MVLAKKHIGIPSVRVRHRTAARKTGTLEYIVADDESGTPIAAVKYEAVLVFRGPVANCEVFFVAENNTVTGNVLSNDLAAEGERLSILTGYGAETRITTRCGGALVLRSDGGISYAPAAKFSGIDCVDYVVADASGRTARASVIFNVQQARDSVVRLPETSMRMSKIGHSYEDVAA